MRFSEPPAVEPGKGSGDELDTLLRAFFQSEMPHPWPVLSLPQADEQSRSVVPLTPAHPWGLAHSRLALAASVGLLLAGSWFLAEQFQTAPPDDQSFRPAVGLPADRGHLAPPDGIKMKEFLEQGEDGSTKLHLDLWDRR
jgi:hypothetical protein